MNLFKFLKRDKPEVATVPEAPEAPKGPPVSLRTWEITVPAGHVMPLGAPITQPFNITVEAGVRWHPEWEEPRITVNVWRFMPQGDAMGWSGPKALAFQTLLNAEVKLLAQYHGQTLTEGDDEDQAVKRVAIKTLGVEAPKVKQLMSDFILHRQGK